MYLIYHKHGLYNKLGSQNFHLTTRTRSGKLGECAVEAGGDATLQCVQLGAAQTVANDVGEELGARGAVQTVRLGGQTDQQTAREAGTEFRLGQEGVQKVHSWVHRVLFGAGGLSLLSAAWGKGWGAGVELKAVGMKSKSIGQLPHKYYVVNAS